MYNSFLVYLTELEIVQPEEWLLLAYYLLLQDRIDEAIKVFARIDSKCITEEKFKL